MSPIHFIQNTDLNLLLHEVISCSQYLNPSLVSQLSIRCIFCVSSCQTLLLSLRRRTSTLSSPGQQERADRALLLQMAGAMRTVASSMGASLGLMLTHWNVNSLDARLHGCTQSPSYVSPHTPQHSECRYKGVGIVNKHSILTIYIL